MWKNLAVDDWSTISLHDCRVTAISEQKNNIILLFGDDGYWIIETNKLNPHNKTLRTDNSQLTFVKGNCSRVLVENTALDGKLAVWHEVSWKEFCQNINSKKWSFEIVREFYAYSKECIYQGYLYSDEAPVACQLEFEFEKTLYEWNKIREDRAW